MFEQCIADACIFYLKESFMSMIPVVHEDDILNVEGKSRCDQFGEGLKCFLLPNNFGELCLSSSCQYSRSRTISHETLPGPPVEKYGIIVSETKNLGWTMTARNLTSLI